MQYSDYTQTKLAARLGVTRAAVSSWCCGSAVPRMDRVKKIADILDVSTDYLHGAGNARLIPRDFERLHHKLVTGLGGDKRESEKRLEEINEFMRFLRAKSGRKAP